MPKTSSLPDSPEFKAQPTKRAVAVSEDGLEFDSNEERYAYWLFKGLQELGAVREILRPAPIELFPGLSISQRRGVKVVRLHDKELLKPHHYTPDLEVVWEPAHPAARVLVADPYPAISTGQHRVSAFDALPPFWRSGDRSLFEVKPMHDVQNKTQFASVNIKWVYQRTRQLVQLLKVGNARGCCFAKLWTPERFRFTDVTGQPRRLRYSPVRTLREYLDSLGWSP